MVTNRHFGVPLWVLILLAVILGGVDILFCGQGGIWEKAAVLGFRHPLGILVLGIAGLIELSRALHGGNRARAVGDLVIVLGTALMTHASPRVFTLGLGMVAAGLCGPYVYGALGAAINGAGGGAAEQ